MHKALSSYIICPFRPRKPVLDRLHSFFKTYFFIYYCSRKHLSKQAAHDIITRLLKKKSGQFLESIDKRLKQSCSLLKVTFTFNLKASSLCRIVLSNAKIAIAMAPPLIGAHTSMRSRLFSIFDRRTCSELAGRFTVSSSIGFINTTALATFGPTLFLNLNRLEPTFHFS